MHLAMVLALGLTLLLTGIYAGMTVMCQIGLLPAMRKLHPHAFADTWRAIDSYLDRTMPPFKLVLLLCNAFAAVLLGLQHRTPLAVIAGASFLLSLLGLVLTITRQLPLNARIKASGADTPGEELVLMREQTTANFGVRCVAAVTAFVALAAGVVAYNV